MMQRISLIKARVKQESPFFIPFFFSLLVPTLLVTLFALLFLEGTQKSQLALLAIAALLFSLGAIKYLLGGLAAQVQRETTSQVEAEVKQIEDLTHLNHQQEIEGYVQKISALQESYEAAQGQIRELNGEMERKLDEIRLAYFEFEDVRAKMVRMEEELKQTRMEADEKILRKETLLNDYQHTIYEQRRILEKKQHYIGKLEAKVHDLMYEMRTLLQLEEPASDPRIDIQQHMQDEKSMVDYYLPKSQPSSLHNFDLTAQLERYLAQAEHFTGADHLGLREGKSSRFSAYAQNSYQIDLRRFFDALKDENGLLLFFFSPEERRFLFVNNYVLTLLGHSPEKFMYKFSDIVESGFQQWRETLERLQDKKIGRCRLVMRSKEGEKKLLSCQMCVVGAGPFRGNVLGILTASDAVL